MKFNVTNYYGAFCRQLTIWQLTIPAPHFGTSAAPSTASRGTILFANGVFSMNGSALRKQDAAAFGQERSTTDRLEDRMIRQALARRLSEKIKNYERAATKLEMRGEMDAAQALFQAAARLRAMTQNMPAETAKSA